MGIIRQGIRLKKASNKKAKFKINSRKYTYTKTNKGKTTKKYSYTSRKIGFSKGKKKYIYTYRG